jgi:hypothetical protein
MLDFAVSRCFPALDEIDPQPWIGGIEGHVTDKTKPMVQPMWTIFTIIIRDTTGSLGLGHLLKQKRMVALFYP